MAKYTKKPANTVFDTGFDTFLKRPGINNEGFDAQRLNSADKAYIKKLLQSVTVYGVNSVNNQTGDVTLTTDEISEGSNLYFTNERAQDAVGAAITDSASIDTTYDDGSNQMTFDLKTSYTDSIYRRIDNTIRTLNVDTTTVGNVTTGEDDLITYTVPSNTLQNVGDFIEFDMAGVFAATANNKQVRVYLDDTLLLDTGALATSAASDWRIQGRIIMTGTGTQKCIVEWLSNDATLLTSVDYSTGAEDETSALVLKATGEATATDDIEQELLIVRWQPA